MKLSIADLLVFCCLASASASIVDTDEKKNHRRDRGRIWGDTSLADPRQFPYYVDIEGFCGGSLITDRVVVTAAHCMGDDYAEYLPGGSKEDDPWKVLVGAIKKQDETKGDAEWIKVDKIAIPKQTKRCTLKNNWDCDELNFDYALMRLEKPYDMTEFSNIELRFNMIQNSPSIGQDLTLIGMGRGNFINNEDLKLPGDRTNDLFFATLPYKHENKKCGKLWDRSNKIPSTRICWNEGSCKKEESICAGKGDSGGPLVSIEGNVHTQIGVVSYLSNNDNAPDVFTRLGATKICKFTQKQLCKKWKVVDTKHYLCANECAKN